MSEIPEVTDALGRVWRRPGVLWTHDDGQGRTTYRTDAALQAELRKAAREVKP